MINNKLLRKHLALASSHVSRIEIKGNTFTLFENPTASQLLSLLDRSKEGSVRGLVFKGNTYWWDGFFALHGDIAMYLLPRNRGGMAYWEHPDYDNDGRMNLEIDNGRPALDCAFKLIAYPKMKELLSSNKIFFHVPDAGNVNYTEYVALKDRHGYLNRKAGRTEASMIKDRINHYLTTARVQTPITVFHGTSTIFLRSILKFGLSPDHIKDGVWTEEELNSNPSRKSHAGIYLTRSGFTAMTYANAVCRAKGGDPLLVAVTLRENSALPDEDDFLRLRGLRIDPKMNPIEDNPYMICNYLVPLLLDPDPYALLSFKTYRDECYSTVNMDTSKRNDLPNVDLAILNLLTAEMQRRLAFFRKQGNSGASVKADLIKNIEYFIRTTSSSLEGKPRFNDELDVPDKYQWILESHPQAYWEAQRRQALDKFIRLTKSRVKPAENDYFRQENGTMRLEHGVGYSGGSRIIGLFTIDEPSYDDRKADPNKKYTITVLRGEVPKEFIDSYAKRQFGELEMERGKQSKLKIVRAEGWRA